MADSLVFDLNSETLQESGTASGDGSLIHGLRTFSEQAYETLVSRFQEPVYNLVYRLLGNSPDACDVVQEVFLKVFRNIKYFRGDSSLKTWIYRIVINQARNRQRWWRRRHRSEQVSLEERLETNGDLPPANDLAEPDRMFGQKELATRIWGALGRLPFDQRTVMVLREIDGLSYDEIAFSLGVAVGTVKSRLTRAREALRAQLREADRS